MSDRAANLPTEKTWNEAFADTALSVVPIISSLTYAFSAIKTTMDKNASISEKISAWLRAGLSAVLDLFGSRFFGLIAERIVAVFAARFAVSAVVKRAIGMVVFMIGNLASHEFIDWFTRWLPRSALSSA